MDYNLALMQELVSKWVVSRLPTELSGWRTQRLAGRRMVPADAVRRDVSPLPMHWAGPLINHGLRLEPGNALIHY